MREKLSVERKNLLTERGQQERMAATITDNMYTEAQVGKTYSCSVVVYRLT